MSLAQYSKEQIKELSLIELAYEYLVNNNKQPIAFNQLLSELAEVSELSDEEVRVRLAQFYTDLNIDGRFLCIGENRWGLRVWYKIETADEEVAAAPKKSKAKAKKKVVDEEDFDGVAEFDEEDEDYAELDDDFADEDDDLLEEEFDELDELDEFDDEDEEEVEVDVDVDVLEDDEEFDLDEEEDLDEDLEVDEEE